MFLAPWPRLVIFLGDEEHCASYYSAFAPYMKPPVRPPMSSTWIERLPGRLQGWRLAAFVRQKSTLEGLWPRSLAALTLLAKHEGLQQLGQQLGAEADLAGIPRCWALSRVDFLGAPLIPVIKRIRYSQLVISNVMSYSIILLLVPVMLVLKYRVKSWTSCTQYTYIHGHDIGKCGWDTTVSGGVNIWRCPRLR